MQAIETKYYDILETYCMYIIHLQACHTQAIDVSRDKFEVGDKADYIYKLYAGPILHIKANSKVPNHQKYCFSINRFKILYE